MELYSKPPLSYDDQVTLLRDRGLIIESTARAVRFLQRVNYYRLSAYTIPFQSPRDVFIAGSTFEAIEQLYDLDEELRRAFLSLLSPIEIFLRTRMAYELSHRWGAFAHYNPTLFHRRFNHTAWVASLDEEVNRAKETFIEHYKSKYQNFPRLPIWIACEAMSLGTLSLLYRGLGTEPQRRICSVFGVHQDVFKSWFHHISYLRNICAHHSRLWNRQFAIRPLLPNSSRNQEWHNLGLDNRHVFSSAVIMEWICLNARISLASIEPIYETIRSISAIDPRFAATMGVPYGQEISMRWGLLNE